MPREESFRLIENQKIKAEINGEEKEFFEIRSYLDNGGYGQVSFYLNLTPSRRLFENEWKKYPSVPHTRQFRMRATPF